MTVTAPSPTAPKAPHSRGFGVKAWWRCPAAVRAHLTQCLGGAWIPIGGPYFGAKEAARLDAADVTAYISAKQRSGLAVKTITNQLTFAHGVFAFGIRRGGVVRNPVALADRQVSPPVDPDVRFLDREELEALLRADAADLLGPTDRVLWLTAAMTGLRQGELAALRWRDVDWTARLVRYGAATRAGTGRRPRAVGRAERFRWPIVSPQSSNATTGARPIRTMTTSSSATRRPAGRTTRARVACASKRRSSERGCVTSGSTISVTQGARGATPCAR